MLDPNTGQPISQVVSLCSFSRVAGRGLAAGRLSRSPFFQGCGWTARQAQQ